jgi:hypothetical protein
MIRGGPAKSEHHLGETVKEFRRQFFFAASTVQLYLSKDLGLIFFLGETSVSILCKMGCDNGVFCYLEKIRIVTTERTHQSVSYCGLAV